MRSSLQVLLFVCVPLAGAWQLATPPPATSIARRATRIQLGSFDDMLAKTAQKKENEAAAAVAPSPADADQGTSLAAQMGRTLSDSFSGLASRFGQGDDDAKEEDAADKPEGSPVDSAVNAEVADIDARAQTGELSFKDFLTMSEAFAGLGDQQLPGVPTLTPAQMAETREKFERHAKICEVMLDDEKEDPALLIEDLKAGAATPGPRIQRLASASGQDATEVALFLMQFEAMRESTRRIAAGEDPDEVNASLAAPPGSNRAARRAAKKNVSKSKKVKDKK